MSRGKRKTTVAVSAAFHALVEGVREGAAVVSLDRKILTCNTRLAEMLKVECPAMLGQSLLTFDKLAHK